MPVAATAADAPESVPSTTAAVGEADVIRRLAVLPALDGAARAGAQAAQARGEVGTAWENPRLAYQREQLFDAETEDSIALTQAFDLSGKRGLRADAAAIRGSAVKAEADAQRIDAVTAARQTFYEALYRQRRAQTFDAWRQRLSTVLKTVEARVASGDAPKYESLRLAEQARQADVGASTERALLDGARERLGASIDGGLPPTVPLSGDLLPPRAALANGAAVRAAITRRGDVVAKKRIAEAARLEERAASRSWVPLLSLTAGFKTVAVSGVRENGFIAGAALELPFFDHGQSEGRWAAAQTQQTKAQSKAATIDAVGRARGLALRVNRLHDAATGLQRDTDQRLEALVKAVEAAYRGGEVGVVELIDAYRADLEGRLAVLDLSWRARSAAIELDRVLGGTGR